MGTDPSLHIREGAGQVLDGLKVTGEGREPSCVHTAALSQGWGRSCGDTARHYGAAPTAPPASFGKAPGTAAKLYSEVSVSLGPELALLKAAPTVLAVKRSSQGCLQ